ncbi:(2Fe-2S)-binding protein [Arcobacter sp. FWKO B]|uniref:(2Fe-2S)-binding protein n=1 Tax=Arcobacter sp. FWKO B TaxID=2593672 RepID=UPI001D17E060|nr:(2Fe-2S)-binding protein [Arcobacter sp. FWKO B]
MASYPMDYEVCKCKHVSLGEILYAIKEKNANTLEKLQNITDAGTACGSCVCENDDIGEEKLDLYLVDILKKIANE